MKKINKSNTTRENIFIISCMSRDELKAADSTLEMWQRWSGIAPFSEAEIKRMREIVGKQLLRENDWDSYFSN